MFDTFPVVPPVSLDEYAQMLLDPETLTQGFRKLTTELGQLRATRSKEEWSDYVRAFRDHFITTVLHQDPFTLRGFRKPRGYAGDAVLIDMIYGSGEGEHLLAKATSVGQQIYEVAMTVPTIQATRGRRNFLASYLDEFCAQRTRPHILSVACGHLREAELSKAVGAEMVGRFVGIDQDRRSLRVIQRSQPGVECIAGSIEDLMESAIHPGNFDFIYTTGLYDYLDDEIGARLLHTLIRMINPGGRILVANFIPDVYGAGYMEAAMDWWLVYRQPEHLLKLADKLPGVVSKRAFRDSFDHLAYLEVQF
jgi:SAM-dependent methyltransferase